MILEFDVGNSRVKWRCLAASGQIGPRGHWPRKDGWAALSALPDQVRMIRVACVADRNQEAELRQALITRWSIEPTFARSRANQAGLQNSYPAPERMGVDRWLAMLAAWGGNRQALCVVDCGSAATIDLVDANGMHLGGYILPGLRMMATSLLQGTGRVRFEQEADAHSIEPGTSTGAAVQHGARLAVCGAVKLARSRCGPGTVCYLTGGDAEHLLPHLAEPVEHRPDLVLDGLAINLESAD